MPNIKDIRNYELLDQDDKDELDAMFENRKKIVCFFCSGRGHSLDECMKVYHLKQIANGVHKPTMFDSLIAARVTET